MRMVWSGAVRRWAHRLGWALAVAGLFGAQAVGSAHAAKKHPARPVAAAKAPKTANAAAKTVKGPLKHGARAAAAPSSTGSLVASAKAARSGARQGQTQAQARLRVRTGRAQAVALRSETGDVMRISANGLRRATASRRSGHLVLVSARQAPELVPPPRQSFGQQAGLHLQRDELELKSNVAYVIDQNSREVLLGKNEQAVLPIASITKLMTGLVVVESGLPLDEPITITEADVDTEKGSSSRLTVGATLTRGELLHLALMSSENRAAHALGRSYPGGLQRFVELMNARARSLGMTRTQYVEPTGLSSQNQSSARDLSLLAVAAAQDPLMRDLSTSPQRVVMVGERAVRFNTTNTLVKDPEWQIGLQKTGYISEAGRCLVMQTDVAGRKLIMVFLDSAGKYSRISDAQRVRRWLEGAQLMGGQPIQRHAASAPLPGG